MNSKYILGFLLILSVVVAGCTQGTTTDQGDAMEETHDDGDEALPQTVPGQGDDLGDSPGEVEPEDDLAVEEFTIERTDSGYGPNPLTVKVGSTVTWVNNSSGVHRPASAQHPTHTAYPGSGITKCGGSAAILDACKDLASGETFSFTFNEVGEWFYHDHRNPSTFGKVIVVE